MSKTLFPETWKQKTIDTAISLLRVMRLMNMDGDVELRSPAKECPECGKTAEVLVMPEGTCGDCWSRKAIAAWKVLPQRFAEVRVGA
ncbi:MAG: hypothetical protein WBW49_06055, partial [Candidatus Acidiferrum sp.]